MTWPNAAALIDDRYDEGVFRIDRNAYLAPEFYEAEIEAIFEGGWVYLCHESQVAKPGDYFATHMGTQPVVVVRDKTGQINAFINACSHRAAILAPLKQGRATVFTCRFHGWSYGIDGKCIKVKAEEGFDEAFDRSHFDLKRPPKVETYRGFVFASLNPESGALVEHLGEARPFIDLYADMSPDGLEILPGSQTYVCDHNWKVQAENVTDGYHVGTVHRNFASTVLHREERDQTEGLLKTETGRIQGNVRNGCYDLGGGHIALWADRASPEVAPLYPATAEVERRVSKDRADWMLRRGRNLLVFPNLVLNDLASTHIRTHRPLAADKTEVTIWCIAPRNESADARSARLRKFEDFFLVTGMATSDDIVSLDTSQAGMRARATRWTDLHRGMGMMVKGPDDMARTLGIKPLISGTAWDQDAPYIGLFRHWRDVLVAAGVRRDAVKVAAE